MGHQCFLQQVVWHKGDNVLSEVKLCCNCKHIFQDWVKAGELYCAYSYFSGDRCSADRLFSLPEKLTCEHFSPALPSFKNDNVKVLISIITLGTRNDLLEQTISSIKEFNDINGDIIITVDGTKDIPAESSYLKDCIIHSINERVGICESLNRSLSDLIKDYDYIIFCDDDVRICSPISKFIHFLAEYPTVGIVSGYHDCRMAITSIENFIQYGFGLIKPITSGCHLVMRCEEVQKMMPFTGGGWIYPFIHFDEWVCRKAGKSIGKIGKGIVSFPCNVEHLGEGRSTWEGREAEDVTRNEMNENINNK